MSVARPTWGGWIACRPLSNIRRGTRELIDERSPKALAVACGPAIVRGKSCAVRHPCCSESMLAGVIQGLVLILAPVIAALVLRSRWREPWGIAGVGCVAFIASKMVQLPVAWGLSQAGLGTQSWAVFVFLLLAPLCEEGARYLALRRVRPESARGALFFGIGHGGVEAAIIGGLALVTVVSATSVPADAPELAHSQAQAVLGAPLWLRGLAVVERVAAVTLHLGATWLVWRAVDSGRLRWLLGAMALHYVFNGAGILVSAKAGPAVGTAVFVAIAVVPLVVVLNALRRAPSRETSGAEIDREAAVSCRALGRRFGAVDAVRGITLDIAEGELFALLGPNGAGKTTFVRLLCGLVPPTSGAAQVAGFSVGSEDDELRGHVGVLTEVPALYEQLSASVNLDIFGRLQGLEGESLAKRSEELLRRFDLWERRDDPVGGFSKGMRQKVAIARTLLHDPPVIFLDEPTSGLDPSAAHDLTKLIESLKERGRTILLTTHRLAEAEALADRVGILQRGELTTVDTVDGLRRKLFGHRVRIRLVEATDAFVAVVERFCDELTQEGNTLTAEIEDTAATVPTLVRELVGAGADILAVEEVSESLESVYLQLVREDEDPGEAAT